MKSLLCRVGVLLLLSFSACDADGDLSIGTASAPIVGGELESGWEGIGAMTAEYAGRGYLGAFCTGSLIAPQWVLTAAHCVEPTDEMPIDPDMMAFFVGTDANPVGSARPSEGRFFPIDLVRIHPEYVRLLGMNDIALAHLAEPADGVPIYDFQRELLGPDDIIGRRAKYVGFGVTDGIEQQGSGIKRSTELLIDALLDWYYRSVFEGSGVCFGDSGGPGLLDFDGEWHVVGVNSLVVGGQPDPCGHKSTHTRVDVFADWIAGFVEGVQPDCNTEADMCLCVEGCRTDGGCDNDQCQILSCRAVLVCQEGCAWDDDMCPRRCRRRANPTGEERYAELYSCEVRECTYQEGRDQETCLSEYCGSELEACEQRGVGITSCSEVATCSWNCPPGDGGTECRLRCLEEGAREAQVSFEQLSSCYDNSCEDTEGEEREACLAEACPGFLHACWQPADCDLRGGDCPAGEVCVDTVLHANDCEPSSEDLAQGDHCEPTDDSFPCADGLRCVDDGEGGRCLYVCFEDGDCADGELCNTQLGVCVEDDSPDVVEPRDGDDTGDDGCTAGGTGAHPWPLLLMLLVFVRRMRVRA